MKAMILAAGVGSRLRPLTEKTPKALIQVGGRTMLERILLRLKEAGVKSVIVNVHHLPERIAEFLRERDFGLEIELSEESVLLETGGGLKKAAWFFDDGRPFFLHNADVISDVDLRKLYATHEGSNALATLAVHQRASSRRLLFDRTGRLCGRRRGEDAPQWTDRPVVGAEELAFAGIHVISPRIFPLLTEPGAFSITDSYLRLAGRGERVQGFRVDESFWAEIGNPERLEAAIKRLGP